MSGSVLEQQVLVILRALEGRAYEKSSPVYQKSLEWISRWPEEVDVGLKNRLLVAICGAFKVTQAEVFATLAGSEAHPLELPTQTDSEGEMSLALPREGFFRDYVNYTLKIEAPMSYHAFSAVSLLGAAIGRKCWIDMGFFKIFGSGGTLLIGPTGKVKKSTAIEIARSLVEETVICGIMTDKSTPEGLAAALVDMPWQFFCASELSVFLGRQRYNEGLVSMILRLLDCPSEFSVRTLTRGLQIVEKPTLTILGGSTMSLLTSSTAEEVLSGGFLNRFLLVIENSTSRCFPIPEAGALSQRKSLTDVIRRVRDQSGEVILSVGALEVYRAWYIERRKATQADDKLAEVVERMPSHVLRLAMIIHLSCHESREICRECFEASAKMINYVERRMPGIVHTMNRSATSQESDYVLDILSRLGGASDHSNLLRRVSSRLNARQFKSHIDTLEQAGRLKVTKKGSARIYTINREAEGMSA